MSDVYNYGEGMPLSLREDTPHAPTTRKGTLREAMEQAYRKAATEGVGTIVVRAGDDIEQQETGNWFDSYISNKVRKSIVTYPRALDRLHSRAPSSSSHDATAPLARWRYFEDL